MSPPKTSNLKFHTSTGSTEFQTLSSCFAPSINYLTQWNNTNMCVSHYNFSILPRTQHITLSISSLCSNRPAAISMRTTQHLWCSLNDFSQNVSLSLRCVCQRVSSREKLQCFIQSVNKLKLFSHRITKQKVLNHNKLRMWPW
jgi:hypothetical protein